MANVIKLCASSKKTNPKKLISYKSLISFIRLPNLLIIVAFLWLLRIFIIGPLLEEAGLSFGLTASQFNLLVLDVVLVTIMGYWMNDWFDKKVDAINRPNRFLVTANWTVHQFWGTILVIGLLVIALSVYIAIETKHLSDLWILPTTISLLTGYAIWFKRYKIIGNLIVSALIAALIPLIIISEWSAIEIALDTPSGIGQSFIYLTVIYTLLIFCINLAREIIKDLEDITGDKENGVIALHQLFGIKNTKTIVFSLLMAMLFLEVPFVFHTDFFVGMTLIFLILMLLTVFISLRLYRARQSHHYRTLSHWLKGIMVLGISQLYILSLA